MASPPRWPRRLARLLRGGALHGFAIVDGHDLDEPARHFPPVLQDVLGLAAAGPLVMPADQVAEQLLVLFLPQGFEVDHVEVAEGVEELVLVEDVGDAAAHAGGEVAAGAAEDHDGAAGHVLAAVVAQSFDDRHGAAVADGESLAGQAVDEDLAAGGAVEERVADDDVFLGIEGRARRGLRRRSARRRAPCPGSRWRRR